MKSWVGVAPPLKKLRGQPPLLPPGSCVLAQDTFPISRIYFPMQKKKCGSNHENAGRWCRSVPTLNDFLMAGIVFSVSDYIGIIFKTPKCGILAL